MARKKEEETEGGAPQWMMTMGDMNTLLMTFFIILFSLMAQERQRYKNLGDAPMPLSLTDPEPGQSYLDAPQTTESAVFNGWEPGRKATPARRDEVVRIQNVESRISTTSGGTILTIGGQMHAFEEGSWELKEEHRVVLRELLKWMAPQGYRIAIRGYTAGNLEDSVVREDGGIQSFIGASLGSRDPLAAADHWLLASLRAREVRNFLMAGVPPHQIAAKRIEVQVAAYNDPLADNAEPQLRHANRRVEVIILPYR